MEENQEVQMTPEEIAAAQAQQAAAETSPEQEAAAKAAKKAADDADKAAKKAEKKAAADAAKAQKKADAEAAKAAKKAAAQAEQAQKKAAAEAAKAANKTEMRNDIRRPKPGTDCGRAWEIFDEVSRDKGSAAAISECKAKGDAAMINDATFRTQYARWRKFNGVEGRVEAADKIVADAAAAGAAAENATTQAE